MLKERSVLNEVTFLEFDQKIISDILKEGLIDEADLSIALKSYKQHDFDILNNLVESGFIKEDTLCDFIERVYNIKVIEINSFNLSKDLLQSLEPEFCLKEGFIPFFEDQKNLHIVVKNFLEEQKLERIKQELKITKKIVLFTALDFNIKYNIATLFRDKTRLESAINIVNSIGKIAGKSFVRIEGMSIKDPIVEFVEVLFEEAVLENASTIHLEPKENLVKVGFKIDGIIKNYRTIEKDHWARVINRIKILSGMNVSENHKFQKGKLQIPIFGKTINLEFFIYPIIEGESLAIKINKKRKVVKLENLGFSKLNTQKIQKLLEGDQKLLLISGTKESGIKTTVNSILHHISSFQPKIVTLEEEVLYKLPLAMQAVENEEIDYSLACIEKQNVDVIFLSEIKDVKYAKTVSDYSLMGHKIISTIRAQDAICALQRLINFGISPNLISNTISGIISQKLLKKLCNNCKQEVKLGHEELTLLRLAKTDVKSIYEHKDKGCNDCNGLGYTGRVMVSEVLVIDTDMDDILCESASKKSLLEFSKKKGFATIFEDARLKVLQGVIDIAEFKKIL